VRRWTGSPCSRRYNCAAEALAYITLFDQGMQHFCPGDVGVADILEQYRGEDNAKTRIQFPLSPGGVTPRVSKPIVPPCSSRMLRQIERPRPVFLRLSFVVKKGANTRSQKSTGIPHPSSAMVTPTHPSSSRRAAIPILPPVSTASTALDARLPCFFQRIVLSRWLRTTHDHAWQQNFNLLQYGQGQFSVG
jgi:hypothetical protein